MKTPYRQVQRMRIWWVCAPIVVLAAGAWVVFGAQLLLGRTLGPDPPPTWLAAVLLLLLGVLLPWLLWAFRLEIEVDEAELRWTVRPFLARRVAVRDIAHATACTYRPIRDYLGWGIRYGIGKGWAYTVRGNRGVCVELRSGRRFLLGSPDPEAIVQRLEGREG